MTTSNRRNFLQGVGSSMLLAGLGSSLAIELGVANAGDLRPEVANSYGDLAQWVARMQEMQPDRLQATMVEELVSGSVSLRQLISAAALANAETFGGQDYVGYHAEMALIPALQMSADLPERRKPLPILKVLYRNSSRIQQFGPSRKTLQPLETSPDKQAVSVDRFGPELRDLVRQADMEKAEQVFATVCQNDDRLAFDTLLYTIADEVDVHRFVLAYRGFGLIDIAGQEHAHTLLRQCVRHCVDFEENRKTGGRPASPIRGQIPKLLDEFKLATTPLGNREPDDSWIQKFSANLYDSDKFEASRAVAEAIAEGISTRSICQAISLACNQLTLRQAGNPLRTHGASAGVHSSDSANAWRHMVGHANDLNTKIGLIVSAWHTGRYDQWKSAAYPLENHFDSIKSDAAGELLGVCEESIRGNDQPTAAAAIHLYGAAGHDPKPVFELMLNYAISEDGRLHSEKYYQTIREEFAFTRPAFRWQYLVALARVTASAFAYDVSDNHGHRAPGYEDACRLLKVDA